MDPWTILGWIIVSALGLFTAMVVFVLIVGLYFAVRDASKKRNGAEKRII